MGLSILLILLWDRVNILTIQWTTRINRYVHDNLLSSMSTPRATISDVLFWRRSNFCLAWHLANWEAQSTCTLDLQLRQRSPWRVWPVEEISKIVYSLCIGNIFSHRPDWKSYLKPLI